MCFALFKICGRIQLPVCALLWFFFPQSLFAALPEVESLQDFAERAWDGIQLIRGANEETKQGRVPQVTFVPGTELS